MNKRLNFPEQLSLTLISHDIGDGGVVHQHAEDGYINATEMCTKAGKLFADYNRLATTKAYLEELSADMGIPISALIQIIKGGNDHKTQGTWVDPQVAIHLAQWLSPKFAVQVSKWVFDWIRGMSTGYMPPHVQRYMANRAKIPPTHFSMLNEIYFHLIAPLEEKGFILPDKMMPDISTGSMFSRFLEKEGIDVKNFPYYQHGFLGENRPEVRARLYPIEHLPKFREYFHNEWLRNRSLSYFEERAPNAKPLLKEIIASLPEPPPKIGG